MCSRRLSIELVLTVFTLKRCTHNIGYYFSKGQLKGLYLKPTLQGFFFYCSSTCYRICYFTTHHIKKLKNLGETSLLPPINVLLLVKKYRLSIRRHTPTIPGDTERVIMLFSWEVCEGQTTWSHLRKTWQFVIMTFNTWSKDYCVKLYPYAYAQIKALHSTMKTWKSGWTN